MTSDDPPLSVAEENNCTSVPCSEADGFVIHRHLSGVSIVWPLVFSSSGVLGQTSALKLLYAKRRAHIKSGAQTENISFVLMITLIWTDLVGVLLTTPHVLLSYWTGEWAGGEASCNYHAYVMMVVGLFTQVQLCMMSVETLLRVRFVWFHRIHITARGAKVMLLVMLIVVMLYCALPFFGVGQFTLVCPGTWGYINIDPREDLDTRHRVYTTLFGGISTFIICVTAVSSCIAFWKLVLQIVSTNNQNLVLNLPAECLSCRQKVMLQSVIIGAIATAITIASWAPLNMRILLTEIESFRALSDLTVIRLASLNQILGPWLLILSSEFLVRFCADRITVHGGTTFQRKI